MKLPHHYDFKFIIAIFVAVSLASCILAVKSGLEFGVAPWIPVLSHLLLGLFAYGFFHSCLSAFSVFTQQKKILARLSLINFYFFSISVFFSLGHALVFGFELQRANAEWWFYGMHPAGLATAAAMLHCYHSNKTNESLKSDAASGTV